MAELGHYNAGSSQPIDDVQSGVLAVNREYSTSEKISFNQILELENAKKIGATAVYFQQFSDTSDAEGSPSESRSTFPQIYIFDKSEQGITDADLSKIHKKLWSGSIVPIYYVLDRTHVKIYSARKPVTSARDEHGETAPDAIDECTLTALADIAESGKILNKYRAAMFRTGEFWRQPGIKEHFDDNETAGKKLLQELQIVRGKIKDFFPARLQDTICHLLMLGIFVKYLEERMSSNGKKVLPKSFFKSFEAEDFCGAIRKGRLADVLLKLAKHFNGEVFNLDDDMKKGVEKLNNDSSLKNHFADFLSASADGTQYVLWRLYDFNYIPVELISRIYEEFVSREGGKPGIAYTPVHLANLMIDECMPMHKPKPNIKICDPSCGSGIFLVTAFKRMVHWAQYENFKTNGQVQGLSAPELNEIMCKSIHGYDKEEMAVKLSVFSLSIAMCDMLEPAKIWTSLRFSNMLKNNLAPRDFFLSNAEEGEFDLIVGNPPFENATDMKVKKKYKPYYNKAVIFLNESMRILKKGGSIAFVMPATKILYNNPSFRKKFFHDYCVEQIMDFTFFRNKLLFENKEVPTVVLFAKKESPCHGAYTRHIVVRRTLNATRRIMFEINGYDIHKVPQWLAEDHRIWKANLLGGVAVYDVVLKLAAYQSLGDILREGKKKKGWVCGEGYKSGPAEQTAKYRQNYKRLQEHDTIVSLTDDGIRTGKIQPSISISSFRDWHIYQSPHLIIKKFPGNKGLVWRMDRSGNFRFSANYFGIHSGDGEQGDSGERVKELEEIAQSLRVNRDIHKFFLVSTSPRAGTGRKAAMMLTSDIESLPMPTDERPLSLSWDEEIVVNDVLEYANEVLNCKAHLDIDNPVSDEDVDKYTDTYCRRLNHKYANNGRAFYADWRYSGGKSAICVIFKYCEGKEVERGIWPQDIKNKIAENDFTFTSDDKDLSAIFKQIFVWSCKDTVIYIKPNARRYWLGSVALRDAADFLCVMLNSRGESRLNSRGE